MGLASVYALFQWSASALGSDRGQAGVLVAALVVGATLAIERLCFKAPPARGALALGLGRPRLGGAAASAGVGAMLLLVVPAYCAATGATASLAPDAWRLLPGLFAQGGIAEETLFRGYLYGHLRVGRSFRRAATLSMPPFVAVHLLLFATMPFPVALAALLLAVVMSFPLARLYDLGGATTWPPALLHFVVQGTVKVVVFEGDGSSFPIVWMAASAAVPWLVFLVPAPARADA